MKPIKIDESNAEKITAALKEVNGKAQEHAFVYYKEISGLAVEAEVELRRILGAKKHFPGAIYYAESGEGVATAYKYSRIGTAVVLERRSSAWFLTKVCQQTIWSSGGSIQLYLTSKQDEAAVEYLRKGYTVEDQPSVIVGYRLSDKAYGTIGSYGTLESALVALESYKHGKECNVEIQKITQTTKSGVTTVAYENIPLKENLHHGSSSESI